METPQADLKQTPLNAAHRQMGARMVPFGGWDMPVQYSGILEEHRAVRGAAGLFDISHMGEIEFRGRDALAAVQRLVTSDASKLRIGQVQYAALCYNSGTFVDDLTVYKVADDHYMVTVNASNIEKDHQWVVEHTSGSCEVRNISDETALLALQGPRAAEILQKLTPVDLGQIRYYWFQPGKVLDADALISRTGYTGEDGFEIYLAPAKAQTLWYRLLEAGRPLGLRPVGLGARDTLRLEAKMALYGNDIDDAHTVLEADLGWIVKLDKGEFIGRAALEKQRAAGLTRRLVGFEMTGRGIGRSHYKIVIDGREIGEVTSGGPSPTLGTNIGLGYVTIEHATIGTEVDILVRGEPVRAKIVPTPFYKRKR
ncbi:MAG: glycine cleavage system aminomethyltransferase GcvT [Candidatus Methylomirabilales bacterium]